MTVTLNKYDESSRISIASFDDVELISIQGYCMVRISQPMMDIGRNPAKMTPNRISEEIIPFPQIVRLKTSLISDQS